jgi:hypothetical protein
MTDIVIFHVTKDPDEDLDYQLDWTDSLEDLETIASYTLSVPTGITSHDDSNTDEAVIFWLSGGTAGETYRLACEIVTSAGRTHKRSLDVLVVTK